MRAVKAAGVRLQLYNSECDVSVSKLLGIEKIWYRKKYRIRYRKNLVSEKVSDSVSFRFWVSSHTALHTACTLFILLSFSSYSWNFPFEDSFFTSLDFAKRKILGANNLCCYYAYLCQENMKSYACEVTPLWAINYVFKSAAPSLHSADR